LIALLALPFQIHFALCRDDRFDVIRLFQRFQPHVIVDHQVNMLQVCTGERVFRNLSDTPILCIWAEHSGQHMADLTLAFAATALDHHHLLSGIAGNQAVPDEFLQRGMSSGQKSSDRNFSQRSGFFTFGLNRTGNLLLTISFFASMKLPSRNTVPFCT